MEAAYIIAGALDWARLMAWSARPQPAMAPPALASPLPAHGAVPAAEDALAIEVDLSDLDEDEDPTGPSMRTAELAAELERAERSEDEYRAWIASLPEERHDAPADDPPVSLDLSGMRGQGKAA